MNTTDYQDQVRQDQIHTMLEQIAEWIPLLDDVSDALLSTPAHGLSLSGVYGTGGMSPTERAADQLREITGIHVNLAHLAQDWSWRGRQLDGSPQHWILARLDWARANRAPDEYEPQIHGIHKRIYRLTGQGHAKTGRLCPGCGQAELRHTTTGYTYCTVCRLTRTDAEVDGLTEARLLATDASLPVNQAGKILGVSRHTINSWIRRGKLETDQHRHVKVRDVRRLLNAQDN